ncbi:site-specific integrase [Pelosinus sp. IPA-1]|uniref:tyrosine-type recombinase/integrase n=1 Tax=Pelosinus sp. IPA-1 TaxID=3029569 RepID=UPI00243623EE|nr:site-specific integrase [Pelosinus sp. IPA-1]GMB02085.1 hypothetical protein PIPA1_48850 [Pelosinus sp. IPA-1]
MESKSIINKEIIEVVNKPIKGLHFAWNVDDGEGNPVTRMLFDPSGKPVIEVWDYLEEIRSRQTNRYSTLSRICYDLCHFYDYLIVTKFKMEHLNNNDFAKFIDYLLTIDPDEKKRPNDAIGKSLFKQVPILTAYKKTTSQKNVIIALRDGIGLKPPSIVRITRRALLYLAWLKFRSPYRARFNFIDLDSLESSNQTYSKRVETQHQYISEKWSGYLKAKGIVMPGREIQPIDRDRVFSQDELGQLEDNTTNIREKLLFFIMKKVGMRISEALSLRWTILPKRCRGTKRWNFEEIKGDIILKDEYWSIWINQRKKNKSYWVFLPKYETQEFERLLDRYLLWRSKQIKKEDNGWVFVTRNNGERLTYEAIRQQFRRIKVRAGLNHRHKLSLHSFRHYKVTYDTNVLGIPIAITVQDTGHSVEVAEKVYRHYDPKARVTLIDGVYNYLDDSSEES